MQGTKGQLEEQNREEKKTTERCQSTIYGQMEHLWKRSAVSDAEQSWKWELPLVVPADGRWGKEFGMPGGLYHPKIQR